MPEAVKIRVAQCRAPRRGIDVTTTLPSAASDGNEIVDLVCLSDVPLISGIHRSRWGEDEFYFCSQFCQHRFADDPEAFIPGRNSTDGSTHRGRNHAAA